MESNKLIAEFLGAKPISLGASVEYEMYGIIECIKDEPNEKHFFIPDEMEFKEDWNWLMPVVEKINNTCPDKYGNHYYFKIGKGYVWVYPRIGDRIFFSGNDINHEDEPMISKVYRGVVEFIKFYNQKQYESKT